MNRSLIRKSVCIFISALLFLAPVTHAGAETTEKRNVFEFHDMFNADLAQVKSEFGYDGSYDTANSFLYSNIYAPGYNLFAGKNQFFVQHPVGIMLINMPDFTIEIFATLYIDFEKSAYIGDTEIARLISAIAALEYSSFEHDSIQKFHELFNGQTKTVIDEAMVILGNKIHPYMVENDAAQQEIICTDGLLVYSGNYDYYLRSVPEEGGSSEVYLVVKAK